MSAIVIVIFITNFILPIPYCQLSPQFKKQIISRTSASFMKLKVNNYVVNINRYLFHVDDCFIAAFNICVKKNVCAFSKIYFMLAHTCVYFQTLSSACI